MVNERVSSSILLGQMEPRMLVMQRSCSRNSIDGKRNDRSLVLVGTEYDVDFDLEMYLYLKTTSQWPQDDLMIASQWPHGEVRPYHKQYITIPWKFWALLFSHAIFCLQPVLIWIMYPFRSRISNSQDSWKYWNVFFKIRKLMKTAYFSIKLPWKAFP